jgi:hypothetical protein
MLTACRRPKIIRVETSLHRPTHIIKHCAYLVGYVVFIVLDRNMGGKCLWCSKVLEGESFMDLIAASAKEEGGQDVHGWVSVSLVENEAAPVPVAIVENE